MVISALAGLIQSLFSTIEVYNKYVIFLKANLEIQFPPEIGGAEEFKAGPGDVAMLTFKVRAFPGADSCWFKLIPAEEEGGEPTEIKIDSKEPEFKR